MAIGSRSSFFSRVTSLAAQRGLHEAIRWLHLHRQQMIGWQTELIAIPAPPFGEEARSTWLISQFQQSGLAGVQVDAIGNVFGTLPSPSADNPESPVILLSAHLDTVFPADTPLDVKVQDDRIEAPGACDNAAGVIGMLAIARAMVAAQLTPPATLVFCGNVGEEGEGDLRGVRHLYKKWPLARRIVAHIVLDGAGNETAVTQALGSRRYRVSITGPGGHSFTDAGTPNPIMVLSSAFASLTLVPLNPYPNEPRVTLNVGTIQGGTSVNTIPESVMASIEFRSTATQALVRMEVALHRAVEDAVETANAEAASRAASGNSHSSRTTPMRFAIEKIGNRPAADSTRDSAMVEAIKAVDRHLGLRSDFRLGSTDANIPLSLGIPSASLGAGGDGGGAHTRAEWYSAANRDLGLRRVLLLALTLLDWAASEK
ncbi:M20/M25/M40 family metallo-hydrolase [Acidicapsa dinghuensis]|uniref:M20/M25/M40 family metallo-hydrolase n=1 Tax=Acidicapsa dinghuensis TaxID=2218256 RepID=A0ABW1EN63_9BACT|nr:M20/M25/M40 family metallo-hydrolase [Acidicapsa dinghuensis]